MIGTATMGNSPYKELVSHGFALDKDGKAMSKSIGNTVAPQKIISRLGADVLRLFFSSTDYFEDVRVGDEIITRVTDAYRRMRNTFRFILGNISDFDPAQDTVAYNDMLEIDRYALNRLNELIEQVTASYDAYEFHKVYHAIYNYCAVDLSSLYMDILKDRLYASVANSIERRSAQTALYEILSALTRMLSPIISHTAEEVWQIMPGKDKAESIILESFPEPNSAWVDTELAQRWSRIFEVRSRVMLALEEARQAGIIGKPMESRVTLTASGELYDFLNPYSTILPSVFIVSQISLKKGNSDEMSVEVQSPQGEKCERCWLVLESVGNHADHPTLCDRCRQAIQ